MNKLQRLFELHCLLSQALFERPRIHVLYHGRERDKITEKIPAWRSSKSNAAVYIPSVSPLTPKQRTTFRL